MGAISYQEALEAFGRYRKFEQAPYNNNTKMRFEEFLGFPVFTQLGWAQFEYSKFNPEIVPEAAAKKIRWLNGPHGYTLFKAWKAQHENQ